MSSDLPSAPCVTITVEVPYRASEPFLEVNGLSFDGVPLYSSVNGIFNLSTVPVDALERVEIVRGASGPRYGSRALGGVIRLQSRDAREDGGFLHLEGGSYGTLSETVGGAHSPPKLFGAESNGMLDELSEALVA